MTWMLPSLFGSVGGASFDIFDAFLAACLGWTFRFHSGFFRLEVFCGDFVCFDSPSLGSQAAKTKVVATNKAMDVHFIVRFPKDLSAVAAAATLQLRGAARSA
jgi:hypothetical protein